MSASALTWCWRQKPRTSTEKLVLAVLADRADDDGECFPSIEWVVKKCQPMSQPTAKRAIASLAEQGFVEKVQRRRRGDGTLGTWLLRLAVDVDVVQGSPATSGEKTTRDHLRSVGQGSPATEPEITDDLAETTIETTMSSTDVEDADGTPKKTPKPRTRNELWDALVEIVGYEPSRALTGAWGVAVRDLREQGATVETLKTCCKAYRKTWPTAELTPTAIAKWWPRFIDEASAKTPTVAATTWAKNLGWRFEPTELDEEIVKWTARGVDETWLRAQIEQARPPIEKLAATA